MNDVMENKFDKMGARVKVKSLGPGTVPVRVDIRRDERGEYFDVRHRADVALEVLDVKRADRHLLLMARAPGDRRGENKSKFLCGHDERSWFVAAIPESAHARDVRSAKDALKPQEVWDSIHRHKLA